MFKKRRYYREYLGDFGSCAVGLRYDTVYAWTCIDARFTDAYNMYNARASFWSRFENVRRVKKKHLHMTDGELSKIYGLK